MRRVLLLAPLLLLACDSGDTDPQVVDADEDGHDDSVDCDDGDPAVHPGADELCNGIDDDCDGEIDAGAVDRSTFYLDEDGDGYGQDGSFIIECDLPEGYAEQGGDCDDANEARNPGRVEICNEIDDDCNNQVDDNPPDGEAWYPDADRDGYGGDADKVLACSPVAGHIRKGGDCDDSLAHVNPDGQEVCERFGRDEDCDGLVNDEDDSLEGAPAWYVDVDEDGYGDVEGPIFACEGPTDRIQRGGDCRDDLPDVNPGAVEACANDLDDDCDGHAAACGVAGVMTFAEHDSQWQGQQSGAELGDEVFSMPDRTGDGRPELGFSQSRWDQGRTQNVGRVALVHGPALGGDIRAVDHLWQGETERGRLGFKVLSVGDIDEDGEPELWVTNAGVARAAILLLDVDDPFGEPAARIDSTADIWDELGSDLVQVPDTDDDGLDDLLIGAPRLADSTATVGGAYLMLGRTTGTTDIRDATATLLGPEADSWCGRAVLAPDTDGDGTPELMMGCPGADSDTGELIVYQSLPSGTVEAADADIRLAGTAVNEGLGASLAAGDLDDDGYEDLVVGSPGEGLGTDPWEGAVYVYFGPVADDITVAKADRTWTGEVDGDVFGTTLTTGDVDGDGDDEVAVGAPGTDRYTGTVYLFQDTDGASGAISGADATAKITGEDSLYNFGGAIEIVPDLDNDGYEDLVIGSPGSFVTATGAGIVYIFRGGPGF